MPLDSAFFDMFTVVGPRTLAIVVPVGMPLPMMGTPTSSATKRAESDVTVGVARTTTPSLTVLELRGQRFSCWHSGCCPQSLPFWNNIGVLENTPPSMRTTEFPYC